MEDKKKKKEDKKKRDSSQKVPDPKIKVPEAAKPSTIQPPSTPGPASPIPPASSPGGGPGASLPAPDGGNNVKQRAAVATGQPSSSSSNSSSSSSSSSGSQATSTAQRYIPREVPPRFRCQQDHKVLLKRGQPPLSSMLLGGGAGGGGATPPPLSSQSGETPPTAGPIDLNTGSSFSSSPSVAAAASSTTSSYANSTWGAGSGSQPPSQGWEKVIVDGTDLEAWPSILGGAKPGSGGASREPDHAPNSSASWNERNVQQKGGGEVGGGDRPSSPHSSSPPSPPPPSSSSLAECVGGSPWGSSPSESGTGSDALYNSNMSHLGPGSQKSPGGSCSSSGGGQATGPGFSPSTNPSAWPALGPEQTQGPGDGLRLSTSPLPPSSGSQPGLQQQQAEGPGAGVTGGGQPWGGAEQGPQRGAGPGATGPGPNQGGGGDGGANRSGSSSSSSSSSWRAMPPTSSSEITVGVSPGEGWGGGGQSQGDKTGWSQPASQGDTTGWGQPASQGDTTGWGQPASQGEASGWGQPSDSSSNAPGASQGAGEGGSTGESGWGGSGNTAIGTGGSAQPGGRAGSSNSSSSGGSGGVGGGALQDSASPVVASGAKAWDNQTAEEKSAERGRAEWGGAGEGGRPTVVGGGVAGAGSSGGGGGAPNQKTDGSGGPSSQPSPNAEVALKSMLSRSDLDPRVLSNVGWGQTQIRQNVAWDMEASAAAAAGGGGGGGKLKDKSSSSSSSSSTITTRGSGYSGANAGSKTTEPSSGGGGGSSGPGPKRDGWDGAGAHQPGRGPHMEAGNRRKGGSPPVGSSEGNPAKNTGGWGGLAPESQGKPWGGEEPQEWRDHRGGGGGGWRDGGEQGRGGWGGPPPESKGAGGWKDGPGGGGGGGGGGRDWGQRESKPGGMWGEGRGGGRMHSDEGTSWGDEGGPQRGGWGGGDAGGGGGSKPHQEWGGGKPHGPPAQTPNSQVAPMKAPNQQHQSQGQPPAMAGGWGGRPGAGPTPPSKGQNQSPGWASGPVPRAAGPGGGGVDPAESSGWEEPSPQSISRNMEIDDGTSAWGDPQRYSTKNVNMWDKNSCSGGQGSGGPGSGGPVGHGPQGPSPPNPQQPPRRQPPSRESGNSVVGMWGKGGGQPDDANAGGWGQSSSSSPSAAPAGWGDPDPDPVKPSGWGNPSANTGKPGPKSGEGWGSKGEGPVAASRHSSWDEEEEGGVWNSGGSQGGWAHGHAGARGHVKGGRGESWGNPMSRQFANMGLLGDDPGGDKKMDPDKRGMSDYNGEMRRGGRGGGGGYRMPGSKDMAAGDMGHYGDKMSGHGGYGGGGGMPPSRGMHQPGGHPMTPTQGLRTPVPHQYMSAQVQGSMMKQMPSPGNSLGGGGGVGGVGGGGGGGGAGGLFPPQLSPQQLAMLSNIYPHVQQFHLACQLLLQQQQQQHQQQQQQLLQNQRKFPQPLRQQTDPQQLARIMAVIQQQRQQQGGGGGGSSKLSPSHLGGVGLPKQSMDPLGHPGGGGVSLSDFHAKTQAMYSGLAPGGNLSGLDLGQGGGPGMKDPGGGQQSRFKWMMEGHSPSSSSPDAIAAMHKNGPIPNPMKNRGGSPYSQYEMLGPEGLGLPPQGPMDHWHRSPGTKMPHKPGPPSWPPEFQPGVPWKGIPSAGDPESDPFMTPGSVMNPPGTQSLQDSDHPLLRDNTGPNCSLPTSLPSSGAWPYSASDGPLANAHSSAKYSEYKPSWPPEPIGHNKLWKTNRISSQLPRPPPGLSSQKQAQPSPWGSGGPRLARGWGGGGGGGGASQDSRFSQGSAWSDGLASRGSCWLLLSNLTPQIDGSTLRTICMQHGPLLTFHLGLTQGNALVRYSSPQEAAKAQGALHMCVLGNTTILAEFVSEEEVARYFAHSQAGGGDGGPAGSAPGGPQGSSGPGPSVASSGGSSPGSERGPATPGGGGGGGGGSVLSTGSGWQNLDGSGSSSEGSGAPGPGLGVFSQWSTNGTAEGAGPGGAEPGGRPGMWGAVTVGYPGGGGGGGGGSMWGAPQMEERHQMDNPAALLPGDLLGGGADSI